MDDALTLCILLGRMPGLRRQRLGQDKGLVELCQRLPLEFMHAVIHARALRKVFISIKGFYFQAEFKGQKVTWIIPHLYGHQVSQSLPEQKHFFLQVQLEEIPFRDGLFFYFFIFQVVTYLEFRLHLSWDRRRKKVGIHKRIEKIRGLGEVHNPN